MKLVKPGDIIIGPSAKRTEAERKRAYRQREGDAYNAKHRAYQRKRNADAIPQFIGVDSEGIGRGKNHRAVLLGVGEAQHIANNLRTGLQWQEVFRFLYSQFERKPKAAYVGFYLSYDFNEWLKTLPRETAHMLLSPQGKAMRRRTAQGRRQYFPVRHDGWEFDMLGFKRLSLRPWCGHIPGRDLCQCKTLPWMHVCDVGPFFQMGFKAVIDPRMWKDDPRGDVCTPEQRKLIEAGKDRRSHAKLDDDMMLYNRLENVILSQVMERLARGFKAVGITLSRDQWYGPGATAAKWLQQNGAPKRESLEGLGIPAWFTDICQKSYYGGWFEIFSHGVIRGESWNYDINNAYPYATCKLPHICEECLCARGDGPYPGNGEYVLVYATVLSKGTRIGAVPYRDKDGNILRPNVSKGWYWLHELQAAERAGLTGKVFYYEWAEFIPCDHDNPFSDVRRLYDMRISVGKSSAQGLAIKLTNNSLYGKFAQSIGSAPFGNWLYSSYITSHCRTQILDAIATHPGGADSVLMVATDGICFDSRHPALPVSKALGEWEESKYTDLCLFKPGVYWHREGKQRLAKIKSRGVPKAAFQNELETMEALFSYFLDWETHPESPVIQEQLVNEFGEDIGLFTVSTGWPKFYATVNFRMKSCKQALNEGQWDTAGLVLESFPLLQSSDPCSKRTRPSYNKPKNRIDTFMHQLAPGQDRETNYYHAIVETPDLGYDYDGDAIDKATDLVNIIKTTTDEEWETIWE